MTRLILILSIMAICLTSYAQGQPEWTKDTGFNALEASYLIVKSAEAQSRESAEKIALEKVKQEANDRNFKIVDSYSKRSGNNYTVYLLAQVARVTGFDISERLTKTNRYKLIGESFVPGMAQIKKGQMGKGVAFIATEAVCVGGIIVSECQRSNYVSKIKDTRDPALMKDYKNKSNTWATTRNIFIGATAAVYVWNVIDGIVAKGKTQIVVGNGKRIAFAPYYNPGECQLPEHVGLAMNVTL